jgi:hypothetical protein
MNGANADRTFHKIILVLKAHGSQPVGFGYNPWAFFTCRLYYRKTSERLTVFETRFISYLPKRTSEVTIGPFRAKEEKELL